MGLSASAGSPLQRGEDFLVVDIERFQGPLDLLLHLIRQQDIEIFDIPIARITRQFLAAIEEIEAGDLDDAGEFLEMAATLVRIKAQMLLPRPEEDDEEDPRAELVRRLVEYEQIREISTRLSTAGAERSRQFGKGYVESRKGPEPSDVPLETTWDEVFEAALEVEMPVEHDAREHRVATRPIAMDEKVALIMETLRRVRRVEFSRLVRPWGESRHGVMTFLAGLELGRRRLVALRQVRPFSELWIYRGERSADEEEDPLEDPALEDEGLSSVDQAARRFTGDEAVRHASSESTSQEERDS